MSEQQDSLAGDHYRSLFEHHPHAVFSLDRSGAYLDANPASEALAGYPIEELREMTFLDLLLPEEVEHTAAAFAAVLEGEPQVVDVRVQHRDGHAVDLNITGVPIVVDDEVVGVYGIAEDVTERNRLQRELETARILAEQANASKSVFLANMSHEIRTPLTTVLAASELLGDSDLDKQQQLLSAAMQRAGKRLLGLVDEILDFSRIEAGVATLDGTDFELRILLEDATGAARQIARSKDVAFEVTLGVGAPRRVHADFARIVQVLANLLDNAVKFTEQGSVRLDVTVEADGDDLTLQAVVSDTGIGMTDSETERIFDAFIQADPSITRQYGGTGLGLAIVQRLVDLMDGEVAVSSVPGAGTAFTVRLPVEPARS